MKQGIHPDYQKVVFMDSATGAKFLAGSTLKPEETIKQMVESKSSTRSTA